MLELNHIVKDYVTGEMTVHALKDVSLTFRRSEFVAILGPSGCGKTTLLNIVGGLDQYTSGDLVINGRSTREYKAADWDTYRNKSIGFVFQSYNLIPHLSVLGNVELALTLTGKSKAIRRQKAEAALTQVGLKEQLHKRPNQLSGGQMQRVAIARAIVNDPEIILADEPTGALDSTTSVQVMDLLKQISRDRLIIMVTHNDQLSEKYSTRIVRLKDGEIVGDTNPFAPTREELAASVLAHKRIKGEYIAEDDHTVLNTEKKAELDNKAWIAYEKAQKKAEKARLKEKKRLSKKTSMSFKTALSLSGRNLATKKGRSIMVSFAGSIGIIGIALVLSISNGFTQYINKMQTDTLAGFPITISPQAIDINSMTSGMGGISDKREEFPTSGKVNIYESQNAVIHFNNLSDEYVSYVEGLNPDWYKSVSYTHAANMTVLSKSATGAISAVEKSSSGMMGETKLFQELLTNQEFISEQYDVMSGQLPKNKNEIAIVVDKYNRMSLKTATALGLNYTLDEKKQISFDDMIQKAGSFKVIVNDNLYPSGVYNASPDYAALYNADSNKDIDLRVVGVLRIKEGTPIDLFNTGMVYHPDLTQAFIDANKSSLIVQNQAVQNAISDPGQGFGKNVTLDKTYGDIFKLQYGTDISAIWDFLPAEQKATLQTMLTLMKNNALETLGGDTVPSTIFIYPVDFETKAKVNTYLDKWNVGKPENDKIMYTDASALLADTMGNMINIISYVLVAFAAVSLVVSSIMIGIITYVSVIERTKEIGVLRSIGARKKDISRVFNAETLIIGFAAGLFGVAVSFLLTFPVNWIINAVVAANGASSMLTTNLAVLNPLHGLFLILISMVLTLISGLIPSRVAAKKDPVVALRSE